MQHLVFANIYILLPCCYLPRSACHFVSVTSPSIHTFSWFICNLQTLSLTTGGEERGSDLSKKWFSVTKLTAKKFFFRHLPHDCSVLFISDKGFFSVIGTNTWVRWTGFEFSGVSQISSLISVNSCVPKHWKPILSFERSPWSVVLLLWNRHYGDLFTDLLSCFVNFWLRLNFLPVSLLILEK